MSYIKTVKLTGSNDNNTNMTYIECIVFYITLPICKHDFFVLVLSKKNNRSVHIDKIEMSCFIKVHQKRLLLTLIRNSFPSSTPLNILQGRLETCHLSSSLQ